MTIGFIVLINLNVFSLIHISYWIKNFYHNNISILGTRLFVRCTKTFTKKTFSVEYYSVWKLNFVIQFLHSICMFNFSILCTVHFQKEFCMCTYNMVILKIHLLNPTLIRPPYCSHFKLFLETLFFLDLLIGNKVSAPRS